MRARLGGSGVGEEDVSAALPYLPGHLTHTIRFHPSRGTSGLFIARLTKDAAARGETEAPGP